MAVRKLLPRNPDDRLVINALRKFYPLPMIIEDISEESGVLESTCKVVLRRQMNKGRVEKIEELTEYGFLVQYVLTEEEY